MTIILSASRPGPRLTMLVVLILTLGLGHMFSAAGPVGGAVSTEVTTLDLTRHRGVVAEGDAGTRGSLRVPCPAGHVVGGGFSHVGGTLDIIESRPDGIYAWRVSWIKTAADDSVLYAYPICMITAD